MRAGKERTGQERAGNEEHQARSAPRCTPSCTPARDLPTEARLPGRAERLTPTAVAALQRSAGNRAVARMLGELGALGEGAQPLQRSSVPDVLRSPGRALAQPVRAEMEARLGADFSDVRLHTGTVAQRSADELGARAYTSGSDIVIGLGGSDLHTLAHKLMHVIQQRQGPVSGTDHGDGLKVSNPSDRFEQARWVSMPTGTVRSSAWTSPPARTAPAGSLSCAR
ncbi:DUF4157 domain-containing protein [Streptomyces sp. NPDC058439]|uniref:eCIS core domain-containing protein n=1 Tax=Streptomyces sp. NPDC058439 TaxID=3346500 RepID=UPI003655B9C8